MRPSTHPLWQPGHTVYLVNLPRITLPIAGAVGDSKTMGSHVEGAIKSTVVSSCAALRPLSLLKVLSIS